MNGKTILIVLFMFVCAGNAQAETNENLETEYEENEKLYSFVIGDMKTDLSVFMVGNYLNDNRPNRVQIISDINIKVSNGQAYGFAFIFRYVDFNQNQKAVNCIIGITLDLD